MIYGWRRTSRASWAPWNGWQILYICAFSSERKIRSFDQILKAFSSVSSCTPCCEKPLLWALGDTKGYSEEWYDLICVLERSLVTIQRRVWNSLFLRRRNFSSLGIHPISFKSVTEWHPKNTEFPTSVWHSILFGNHFSKWEWIFIAQCGHHRQEPYLTVLRKEYRLWMSEGG